MYIDQPIAAKISLLLKDSECSLEDFISLSTMLYQNNLIYAEPRELRQQEHLLELTVIFRSRSAFENWIRHPQIQAYWSEKFNALLTDFPSTEQAKNILIEVDKIENCTCEASEFYILQGRSFQFVDELTCGSCLKQIPYDRIPLEIELEKWQNYHQRFYLNWLDSGIFEQDALQELTDYQTGKLHQAGEQIRAALADYFQRPVYLNYFVEDPDITDTCVICHSTGIASTLQDRVKFVNNVILYSSNFSKVLYD